MNTQLKQFPLLFSISSTGKIVTVEYSVEQLSDGSCDIVNSHGQVDGKKIVDRRNIRTGKNIGKANETTVQQQALSEAESKWKKKQDENYTTNSNGQPDKVNLLPMLAHKFKERKHNIKYPCIVQPKLNGVRSLAPGTSTGVKFMSRGGKPYDNLGHLVYDVMTTFTDIPDGEIYLHGLTLQEINRRVKKYRPGLTEELQYWVYDLALPAVSNQIRVATLNGLSKIYQGTKIVFVPSYVCVQEADIKRYHDQFVSEGFEGVIIRNMDGLYEFDTRSVNLQKYKEFEDDEFEIIGFKSGEGRESGAIIYTCKVKNPVEGGPTEFDVRPRGSILLRRKWLTEGKEAIGKQYTVRYFELSENNVPSGNPVGVGIREEGE